jgi:hypothetical protein
LNAVEIEQAISALAEQPFDAANFPYAFLEAFGNKETTIKRLRAGASNKSDLGGVLQTNNIHIATCATGQVSRTLQALKASPATAKAKAKFVLATDGVDFEAEDLASGATVACAYADFPDHFGFFLPLAGITTVRQVAENAFDIRATSRLNRLYVELLKDNPDWGIAQRRHDMNHFMARLIFCFFAEDTGIFIGKRTFTATIEQMSARDSSNTHEVIGALFLAMNTPPGPARAAAGIRSWADCFPFVNGGLFSGSLDVPRFSKIARSYLLHVGGLDWTRINPDIFGSMIQAVAEDEERGELGMHYTSVPNILKVLNPLFLDDLRARLAEAGDNPRSLLNLRRRLARIRVFDPACGSGNFLVIAYKEMRAIEAEINRRRGEAERASEIPLTNFRGIELRDFPAEIARLALVIAEYQCDVLYRGEKLALAEFLPLNKENWITCGNALVLDWLSVCPPTGTGVKLHADDLFATPLDQAQIDFANEGGETYICGNPPYQGSVGQTATQKSDMARVFEHLLKTYKDLDYVAAFVLKVAQFNRLTGSASALVATNSVTQGEQVAMLWPLVFREENSLQFAHTSFLWSNLASNKAAVTCVILGLTARPTGEKKLFTDGLVRTVPNISPYLLATDTVIVTKETTALSEISQMHSGNKPTDGGHLTPSAEEVERMIAEDPGAKRFFKRYVGSRELIHGGGRWCIWVEDTELDAARSIRCLRERFDRVRLMRSSSKGIQALDSAATPHRFVFAPHSRTAAIAVPNVSSERRQYLPCALTSYDTVISNAASAIYNAPLWNLALIASRVHLVWIATVCGKLETRYRYSNTLGWNTFPVPSLTDQNKADLTRCAEDILLTRERHFPATIADLYDPDAMPAGLRAAHERNDEVLERIYIGRRFKNDTERLEKLFEIYIRMTAAAAPAKTKARKGKTPA